MTVVPSNLSQTPTFEFARHIKATTDFGQLADRRFFTRTWGNPTLANKAAVSEGYAPKTELDLAWAGVPARGGDLAAASGSGNPCNAAAQTASIYCTLHTWEIIESKIQLVPTSEVPKSDPKG